MSLAVLKLGGSILTQLVGGLPKLRLQRMRSLAEELSDIGPLVLVHGSGTFGKPPALTHGYLHGRVESGRACVVSSVTQALEVLHNGVLREVRSAGSPACSLHAAHLFDWRGDRLHLRTSEPVRQALARGLLPIVASGFVPDLDSGGFAIASSDTIASALAQALRAERLVFATQAHGVYNNFPRTDQWHEELVDDDLASLRLVAPTANDVTGGMAAKLRSCFAAAHCGIATFVIDGRLRGNVAAALRGDAYVGTRLVSSYFSPRVVHE